MPKATLEWTPALDAEVKKLLAEGMSKSEIARTLGIHRVQLLRRINELGITPESLAEQPQKLKPLHISQYQRARRGFYVPEHLEDAYYELLKSGVPIDEARRKLKIRKDS